MSKTILTATLTILFLLLSSHSVNAQSEEQLKTWLKKYPDSDANKDGVLSKAEAIKYRKEVLSKKNNKPKLAKIKPTHADVSYGTHKRNVLDLWLVESDKPTPILICIHGGGFRAGDKAGYHSSGVIQAMHKAGISVAAINYRYSEGGKHPYPAQMHDSGRALQFLRHHAEKYNIAKEKFAATGGSAGACILMWLGMHPDLADPDNKDPILHESTRIQVLAPVNGPTSLHLNDTIKWFEVDSLIEHPAMRALFALPTDREIDWTEKLNASMRDASAITHLTKDDPPLFMTYPPNKEVTAESNPNLWVHHPKFGFKLKEAADKLGVECHVVYQGGKPNDKYRSYQTFVIEKLTDLEK